MKSVSRIAGAALVLALAGTSLVQAQGRPDARQLTCNEARSLIAGNGAVVMTTGPNTYERYVAGTRFCYSPEVAVPAWISTRDTSQCVVARCRYVDRDELPWRWRR
jgi:hypothetical protein